ncbi:MAG TPA: BrnT family toxin [Candidatus Acidoferrum sp.]
MHFERDDTKNRQNQHKHGIAFEAQEVFLDPLRITMETRDVDAEEKFVTIGSITRTFRLMVVVYTLRLKDDDETVRIISARKATPNERKSYEKAH